jgi:hypothetical protein
MGESMYTKPLAICVSVLTAATLTGCSRGPSTREEVCASFDTLGQQMTEGNGVIGNPLFHKAGALADVAERYPGSPGLADDAKRLHRIANADSTSIEQLLNATTHIADLCGHPLGLNRY